ncbi:MAG TPA: MFS transporter [Gemmatimonadales bacterium]|nr:MFS transporter [Gemmatimonadales bacterium]
MTGPPDDAVRGLRFGALAHRNFRLFFFGQGVSLIGTWMQNVAQGWLVYELTNSPFYVGLVSALGSLGVLLLTIYAGIIVDRTNKHRVVIVTQALSMVPAFALAVLVWTNAVAVWHVAALAAFLGVLNAFDIPARQAFIVELTGKEDLMNAIALNSAAFNAARVLGPAVAGALIGAFGVGICFFLNGLSYLAVIAGLLAMRLPPYLPAPRAHTVWAGLREAVAFIRGDRRVSTLVLLMALLSIFGFPYLVMMPVFARDVLGRGAAGYGVMMASVGIGALVGALGVAVRGRRILKGVTLLAAGCSFGVLLLAFALSKVYVLSVALLALTGATMIVNNALANTTIQTLVPDALRGRVMGFYAFVFVGLAPLGAFQLGALAQRIGAPAAVALGGAVSALAVALAAWRVPELRRTS